MGKPVEYNLNEENSCAIYKGADYSKTFTFSYDLEAAGVAGASQVRRSRSLDADLVATFTVTISGTDLTLSLTDTQSAAITGSEGTFDIFLTNSSDFSEPAIYGVVEIIGSNTDIS